MDEPTDITTPEPAAPEPSEYDSEIDGLLGGGEADKTEPVKPTGFSFDSEDHFNTLLEQRLQQALGPIQNTLNPIAEALNNQQKQGEQPKGSAFDQLVQAKVDELMGQKSQKERTEVYATELRGLADEYPDIVNNQEFIDNLQRVSEGQFSAQEAFRAVAYDKLLALENKKAVKRAFEVLKQRALHMKASPATNGSSVPTDEQPQTIEEIMNKHFDTYIEGTG